MRPVKALGQNFLTRPDIAEDIVVQTGIKPSDTVWEIGPGKGILTRELVKTGCHIKAFELDRRLEEPLHNEFGDDIELVMGDVLRANWNDELSVYPAQIKLVANIPYNITSPLLYLLERHHQHFSSITLMVQKEVAQRICASPGSKAYGVMTLRLKRIFDTEILFFVPKENFDPVPEVDSAVIILKQRKIPAEIPELRKYLSLIDMAFAHRRKTLRNNLSSLGDRERLEIIQTQSGIDLGRRGETLSEAEFIVLSKYI